MTFNPNPEIPVLVVSYNDGRLCLFDYLSMAPVFTKADGFAQTLSCSQDGRTLATGGSDGTIEVFEFDQDSTGQAILVPVYRVNKLDDAIRGISLSPDGLRILDIQSQQCHVWTPAALVRSNNELESASEALTLAPTTEGMFDFSPDPEISSPLSVSRDGRCIVAGKDRGVSLFSTEDGKDLGALYEHTRGASVHRVAIGEARNFVISADNSSQVLVAELPMPLSNLAADSKLHQRKLLPSRIVLNQRVGSVVMQLLVNESADRLLIISRTATLLWELPSGRQVSKDNPSSGRESSLPPTSSANIASTALQGQTNSGPASELTAFQHPGNEAWFVVVSGDIGRIFNWEDHAELTPMQGLRLQRTEAPSSPICHDAKIGQAASQPLSNLSRISPIVSYHSGPQIVVESLRYSKWGSLCLTVWPSAAFDPTSSTAKPLTYQSSSTIAPMVSTILGLVGTSTLVFIDNEMWVCSADLETLGSGIIPKVLGRSPPLTSHARRHFFALSEWWRVDEGLNCILANVPTASIGSKARDVAFAHGHRLIVMKGGFEFAENVVATPREEMNTNDHNGVETHRGRSNQGGQCGWVVASESVRHRI